MRYAYLGARLFTSLAAAALLAGCVAGTREEPADQQSGPVTVEFWTINLKKNYGDYIQGLIDGFEQDHQDISIEWVDVPGQDVESKFLAAIASNDVPDAVNIEDFRVDQFGASLADLNPYFDEQALDRYLPDLINGLRRDGKLKAIPWYNGGAPVAAYDQKVLDSAGISADALPTSWDEAFAMGKTIKDSTDRCAFNALPTIGVLMSYGVPLLNAERTSAELDNSQAAEVLERFRAAYRDGVICPGAVSEQDRNLPQSLENGLAAAAVNDLPFVLLNVKKNAPEVYERLVVNQAVTGSTGKYAIPGMQTFVVPERSDVQRQAAEFIKWVTSPENQLALCKLVTVFPSTAATLQDPFFTEINPSTPSEKARKVVVSELPKVFTADLGTTVDTELQDAYLKRVRAYLTGDAATSEVLAAIAEEWNKLLRT